MKTELQYSTNVYSERSTPPDAKPMLPAVASTVVYLEDCVQALKRFEDNYFDVAIVDPPYGMASLANYRMMVILNTHVDGRYKDSFSYDPSRPFLIQSFQYDPYTA